MILELQTYTLKSRTVALVEQRFEKALAARVKLSPLAGFWRTEVGVLNQVIALWSYESTAERERVLAAAAKLDQWPPQISEFVVEQESKVLVAAPFSPPLAPRQLGRLYEIRTYHYPPGGIPEVISAWNEILEERLKYSPLVAACYSETGPVHEWVHIWAYRDAAERERVREATAKAGIWPISVVDQRLKRTPRAVSLRMQNLLMVPASFSPLH